MSKRVCRQIRAPVAACLHGLSAPALDRHDIRALGLEFFPMESVGQDVLAAPTSTIIPTTIAIVSGSLIVKTEPFRGLGHPTRRQGR
jgi:hypothetical protein